MRPFPSSSAPCSARRIVSCLWWLTMGLLAACADDAPDPAPDAGPSTPLQVQIGVPGGDNRLQFEPLLPGDDLQLETAGQGGTHVELAVRCHGCGVVAYVTVILRNLNTGDRAHTLIPPRQSLLLCRDDGPYCDAVPVFILASTLAPRGEREGVPVEVVAQVSTDEGGMGEARLELVLRDLPGLDEP